MKVPYHTLPITTPSKKKPSHANPKFTAKRKMILTTCAACAAPLAHDAPRCVRCKLRYCDATYGGCGERRAVFGGDPADATFIMYRPRHARSTRAVAQHLFVAHRQQLRARFELGLSRRVPLNTLADQSAGRQHDHRTSRMARRRLNCFPLRYASDVLP